MLLQTKSKRDGRRVVEHLEVYEENYEKAWVLQDQRHSNQWTLVGKKTQPLIDCSQVMLQDQITVGKTSDAMG